jgi:L-alanine-DL-glutamate epimerase-like enolase superfamily enzyme
MRIDCIRTHHLRGELAGAFRFSQWFYNTRYTLLAEIVADGGTIGWGECYGSAEVQQGAISSFYDPRLLAFNPLATNRPLPDQLAKVPVTTDNATANVPTGPGVGVAVDRAAIKSFHVKEAEIR